MLGFIETSDLLLFIYCLFTKIIKFRKTGMFFDECPTNLDITSTEQKAVFSGDLPHPLTSGHYVEIIGTPLPTCSRFSVNFQCDKNPESDIAFHFNPRLDMKYIVRNSRVGGHWEQESTASSYRYQLPRGTTFCLNIFISPKEFMVSINGLHFCSFPYRIQLVKVRYIVINGDVNIHEVNFKKMSRYPLAAVEDTKTKSTLFQIPFKDIYEDNNVLQNPFIGHLPKGIQPGWQLEIHGKVKLLPHSFYVNLQEGDQYWPHPNIPLHLNPRFNTTLHSHTLIRNNWVNGSWGQEEVCPSFHFVPSKPFRLVIQMENEKFLVWVNSCLQGEFKLRPTINSVNIDTVYIQGDLYLYKIFVLKTFTNMISDLL